MAKSEVTENTKQVTYHLAKNINGKWARFVVGSGREVREDDEQIIGKEKVQQRPWTDIENGRMYGTTQVFRNAHTFNRRGLPPKVRSYIGGKYVESVNAIGNPYAESKGHGWRFFKMDWMARLIDPYDRPLDPRDAVIDEILKEYPEYRKLVDPDYYEGPTELDYGLIFQIGKDIENLTELF